MAGTSLSNYQNRHRYFTTRFHSDPPSNHSGAPHVMTSGEVRYAASITPPILTPPSTLQLWMWQPLPACPWCAGTQTHPIHNSVSGASRCMRQGYTRTSRAPPSATCLSGNAMRCEQHRERYRPGASRLRLRRREGRKARDVEVRERVAVGDGEAVLVGQVQHTDEGHVHGNILGGACGIVLGEVSEERVE